MQDEKAMENPHSVNSPRRILSFSRNRKATVFVDSFPDVEEKASGSGVSRHHGPNHSEVYGFVGSISTAVASGLNFMATPPPTSFSSMFDEYSKEPLTSAISPEEDEQPIEPFSDIGIDQINDLIFNDSK